MRKINILFSLYSILALLSCGVFGINIGSQKADSFPLKRSDSNTVWPTIIDKGPIIDTTVHFFEHCTDLEGHATLGYLQDVEGHPTFDSTGPFYSFACYQCKESYEVYFDLRGGISERTALSHDSLWKVIDGGCQNLFSEFNCYAFVLPMRDPDKEDEHEMNIDFPVVVRIYKRITLDNWQFIRKVKIPSFSKYSRLIFNCIYGYE